MNSWHDLLEQTPKTVIRARLCWPRSASCQFLIGSRHHPSKNNLWWSRLDLHELLIITHSNPQQNLIIRWLKPFWSFKGTLLWWFSVVAKSRIWQMSYWNSFETSKEYLWWTWSEKKDPYWNSFTILNGFRSGGQRQDLINSTLEFIESLQESLSDCQVKISSMPYWNLFKN